MRRSFLVGCMLGILATLATGAGGVYGVVTAGRLVLQEQSTAPTTAAGYGIAASTTAAPTTLGYWDDAGTYRDMTARPYGELELADNATATTLVEGRSVDVDSATWAAGDLGPGFTSPSAGDLQYDGSQGTRLFWVHCALSASAASASTTVSYQLYSAGVLVAEVREKNADNNLASISVSGIVPMASGDTLELRVEQIGSTGSTVTVGHARMIAVLAE